MTKKRFKLSMAALGLLAAFFMVLIAVLLAPTLASANKDAGTHHPGGNPGTGYPHGGSGPHGLAANGNESGHDHGDAFDAPFCVDGGVYPCTVFGDTEDALDGAGGNPNNYENGFPGGGNPQGGGSPNGSGPYSTNFWGGSGAGGGGAPGGGIGDGGGQDGDKAGTDESGNPDSEDGDKTKNSGPEVPPLTLTLPEDDGQPSDFVDPPSGDEGPKTEDDPNGEEQPITEVVVTEVPEPLTLSLFAVGLAGAAQLRRRSRQSRQD
jgi:hypothetical protein